MIAFWASDVLWDTIRHPDVNIYGAAAREYEMRTRPLAGDFTLTREVAPVLEHRGGSVLSPRTMATTNPPRNESSGTDAESLTTTRRRLPDRVTETLATDRYGRPDGYAYTCERCGLTVPARDKSVLVECCE